jgi:ribosome-associated protein
MNQEVSAKEQSLHPETIVKETAKTTNEKNEEPDANVIAAVRAADDKKALETVVLDLRELASFTDYFIITSGANTRQVQAIADGVVEELKKQGKRASRVEGYSTAEWILVDYGDFVLHVFEDKARKFYDLERLWREAIRVNVPGDVL